MKIAIMQPKFLPYIGYWQLVNAVDTFIIFDDVNFVKKAYINHNTILADGKSQQFSLELIGASQNKLINEINVGSNSKKLLKTIELNYKKTPYFETVFPILEGVFNQLEKNLAKFIGYSLKKISNYLEIDTQFVYSSDIDKNNSLKAQYKIIDICQKLNAKYYINAIGGKKLYEKKQFLAKNINLGFLDTNLIEYKQSKNKFITHLSIIDVMMYNNKIEINNMLKNYKLI